MLALLLSAATVQPSTSRASVEAFVRVIEGARIQAHEWAKQNRKTERVIVDENGRRILLRLAEFE